MSDNDLDIFDDLEEVTETRDSNPRLPIVIGALIVAGLLIGIVVSVIVGGFTTIASTPVRPGSVDCGGAAICNELTLDEVRSLSGIHFSDDATVISAQYAETDSKITVTARVLLADGEANPLDDSAYGTISQPTLEWPTDDLSVLDYYAASGEAGTLYAEAVHAVDDKVREVVLVVVTRTLD